MQLPQLIHEYPWVRVNPVTWDIEQKGSFHQMNTVGKGHMMTEAIWKQLSKEAGLSPQDLTQ